MKFSKILKRLFITSTLGAIFPVLLVPGDGSGDGNDGDASNDGNGEDSNSGDNDGNNDSNNDGDGDDTSSGGKVVFNSQAELDAMIQRRLNKAVKKANQLKDEELKKSKMTEIEKANHERDEANKKAENSLKDANNRLIKAEVIIQASKMKIVDGDAAYMLLDKEDISIDENGKIAGVEAALKNLIAEKSYLVGTDQSAKPTGDDQNNQGNNPGGNKFSMNNLIRRAAGRSD